MAQNKYEKGFSPRAVCFDMDGTLVDSEPLQQEADRLTLAELGAEWTPEDGRRYIGVPDNVMFEDFIERFNLDKTVEELRAVKLKQLERLSNGLQLVPGAARVMDAVKTAGLPIGVVTASPRPVLELFLSRTGLTDFFDVVLSGEDPFIARNKPEPDVYLAGAERLGVNPRDVLVFEDSRGGVKSAVAAGMRVIIVRTPQNRHLDFSESPHASLLEGGFPDFDAGLLDGQPAASRL